MPIHNPMNDKFRMVGALADGIVSSLKIMHDTGQGDGRAFREKLVDFCDHAVGLCNEIIAAREIAHDR